jgi:catecholate siderophore receptor
MKANRKQRTKRHRKALTGGRAWLAVGAIAAYTAAGSGAKAALRLAQGSSQGADSQAQLPVWRFNITAGPLDQAIAQFTKICGVPVQYSIPAETIPGFRSNGVSGLYTQQQALRQLLAGTGLNFKLSGNAAVVGLRNETSVEVNSNATDSIALSRFPVPLVNTPQSITVIPGHVLDDQGVATLRDTLRNAPGISLAAGEGGAQGDNLTIRGFTAQDDIFLDGMRDIGSYYRDPFNYERVDVLEGPAGVDFGRGSTGGIINQESKAPEPHPIMSFDGTLGADATRRFTADINQPLPHFAEGAAFRLNLMGHDAGVSERDVTTNRRYGIAPTFAVGLGTPTRLTTGYFHFTEDDIPDYGLPWYFGQPAAVPRQNYYGFADHNFLRTDVDMGTIKVEHDLGAHGLLRDMVRYGNYQRKWQITEPQVDNTSAGTITPQTPLSQVMVNRNQLAGSSVETSFWDQLDLTLTGKLLGIRQTAVVGAEGGKETSDPVRLNFNNAAGINTVPLTSLLDPDPSQAFSGIETPKSVTHTTTHSFGVYLLDTFELSRQWELSGGIRWDRFDAAYNAVNYALSSSGALVGTPAQFIQPLDKPTWRGALVYKPVSNGSIYFDYGTSFDPSAETLSLTAATAATPPEENQTFEFGSKWDVRGGRLSLRGALFRTEKENAREPDPTDSSIDVLAGNQRVDGAEGMIQGRITDRWEVLSSYTFMHSEVVSSKAYPFAVGQPLNNVPENLFNLWTEYRLPRGFEIGGGSNFVGERDANTATLTPSTIIEGAPGYVTFNAMAKYNLSERITLQANVNNLTNRFFIDELHPGHAIPGEGATALFAMKVKF